ncbi:hypothetical protein AB4259_21280 [Vibrio amylolyticus]|uniref:hypothetical protein n=1 Tax=Vibrio amylolyticus TaxID=2847292 RepID=UPI00354CCE85
MFEYLTSGIIGGWLMFFSFIYTHIKHSDSFSGSSRKYEIALMFSTLFGSLTLFYLMFIFFQKAHWYSPILLFMLGGFFYEIVFRFIIRRDPLVVSASAFLGWPIGAYFFYQAVEKL